MNYIMDNVLGVLPGFACDLVSLHNFMSSKWFTGPGATTNI